MTHEHEIGDEAHDGPEHDERLGNAWEIPVADGPFDLPAETSDDWDDDMEPGYASELAAAVALGLAPEGDS